MSSSSGDTVVTLWRGKTHTILKLNQIFRRNGHFYISATLLYADDPFVSGLAEKRPVLVIPADNKLLRKMYSAAVSKRFYVVGFLVNCIKTDQNILIGFVNEDNLYITIYPNNHVLL